jgi:hypothetical protein
MFSLVLNFQQSGHAFEFLLRVPITQRNSYLCTKGVTTMITPGERLIQLEGFSPRDGYRSMGVIIR